MRLLRLRNVLFPRFLVTLLPTAPMVSQAMAADNPALVHYPADGNLNVADGAAATMVRGRMTFQVEFVGDCLLTIYLGDHEGRRLVRQQVPVRLESGTAEAGFPLTIPPSADSRLMSDGAGNGAIERMRRRLFRD